MATVPGRYSNPIHSPDSSSVSGSAQASQARANTSNSRDTSSELPLNEIRPGPSPSHPNPSNDRPSRRPNTTPKNPFRSPPDAFVDLTQESPSMSQPVRDARSGKRMLRDSAEMPPSSTKKRRLDAVEDEIEELDLCDVQSDTDLARVLERQRVATVRAQQEQADLPTKLANMTCVVCMEEMTNMTATHCGRFSTCPTSPLGTQLTTSLARPSVLSYMSDGSADRWRESSK